MYNYVKGALSALIGAKVTPENELLDEESEIIDNIKSINLGDVQNSDSDEEESPLGKGEIPILPVITVKLVHRTGKITYFSTEFGVIDNVIHFVPSQVSSCIAVKVNDEVLYTAYKARDNESERVHKIYGLKKDSWEHDTGNSNEKSGEKQEEIYGIVKHIPGRVTNRNGRNIYIEPIDTWCNLDRIEAAFIPIEGDWVTVGAVWEFKDEIPNFTGDLLQIKSIKPLLQKSTCGRISLWSVFKKEGAIENLVHFTIFDCENGYLPSLGDEVVYDAIESDQGTYKWRAVLVRPSGVIPKRDTDKDTDNLNSGEIFHKGDDKMGVTIHPSVCTVELELQSSKNMSFQITNNSSEVKCLKNVYLANSLNPQLIISKKPYRNFFLKPNQTIQVHFTCKGQFVGLSGEIFFFRFEGFTITRKIEINVLNSTAMGDLLKSKNDLIINVFKKKPALEDQREAEVVLHGPKPWQAPKFICRERSYVFSIPKKLQDIMEKNLQQVNRIKALEKYAPYLKLELSFSNYAQRFHTFLYLEEIELHSYFKRYRMYGVYLNRIGDFFSLKVPGLVESRPSVIVGDSIVLRQPWLDEGEVEHVGYIYEILEQEVLIKFHSSFHDSYDESECNVEFLPNTFIFQRCHEAVKRAERVLGEKWLFPSSVDEKPPQIDIDFRTDIEDDTEEKTEESHPEPNDLDAKNHSHSKGKKVIQWVNKDLNKRQKLAVVNVLKGQGRPLPYIIFGPPGTGKTVTLVEIILQLYKLVPDCRILVTTPSNSAADLICHRLLEMAHLKPGELIRLTAITRVIEGLVPPDLRPYTTFYKARLTNPYNYKQNENLQLCSMNDLSGKHRITVSTCTYIGRLHFSEFGCSSFTHILIDEAGQTIEPETLIPATFLNRSRGQVVLAGDPQQLGAVINSRISKFFGFGISLLERFTKMFPYAQDLKSFPDSSGFDPRFITRLNINYRSVPEILTLPSQMFYDSDLIPNVSQMQDEEARIIEKFNFMGDGREKPAAFIFHGVIGQNYQEPDSPSWFNPQEIWQVVLYLQKLYSIGLTNSDVGILTPYAKQVEKLRYLIQSVNLAVPKVGSVEEYQGQEKKVIILSTVRSSLKYVAIDVAHHLGFVACPKRVNVSLTRARALLIIVGNPVLLSHDPYWVNVIKYSLENKSYTGCNLNYFNSNLNDDLKKEIEKEEGGKEEGDDEEERKEEEKEKGAGTEQK